MLYEWHHIIRRYHPFCLSFGVFFFTGIGDTEKLSQNQKPHHHPCTQQTVQVCLTLTPTKASSAHWIDRSHASSLQGSNLFCLPLRIETDSCAGVVFSFNIFRCSRGQAALVFCRFLLYTTDDKRHRISCERHTSSSSTKARAGRLLGRMSRAYRSRHARRYVRFLCHTL